GISCRPCDGGLKTDSNGRTRRNITPSHRRVTSLTHAARRLKPSRDRPMTGVVKMEPSVSQRILVVEDDARIADLIAKNLEAAGFECVQARDGDRALAEVAKLRPALIVLDLGLAGLDGVEVTRRVRRESDKLLGLEVGADDYVTKPFSTAELVARVRALLRRSSGVLAERALEIGG